MAATKRDWQGMEHLPRQGGFVAVTNHNSHLDPFVFAHYLNDQGYLPHFLAKIEVFRIPVAGRILRAAQQIPVYRETGQAADAYRAAVAAVRAGQCVAIYPEGSLTRDPDQWPMRGKTGAARIALQTRCPVIPVAQWGANQVIGTYSRRVDLFPRKVMHVRAGPAVPLEDLYDKPLDRAVLREATDRIMAAITTELEVLRGESAPPVRFDPREHNLTVIGRPEHTDAPAPTPSEEQE
jgi:1-acyl-sn-glycerol-3-phosphate acyltransferase